MNEYASGNICAGQNADRAFQIEVIAALIGLCGAELDKSETLAVVALIKKLAAEISLSLSEFDSVNAGEPNNG
ncbi:hypothetical protein [Morganella morganii]|uniref:hypothetical protein n=1 Tax=Morganella morganii TaxID=582 RepID=UPI000BFE4B53|nr:hypothetical protein [Morganella morganii]EKU4287547.1 hypothetical protein [Morganella morganii]EKU4302577.1 hypothetical protein [Morganella morganii]EKU5663717.1 hypothetical protein [Morganella morganii]EKU5691061.1 hypothetical protein [Morganella morganii]EKU6425054.1 hypothetical protein [Morganella morganii]